MIDTCFFRKLPCPMWEFLESTTSTIGEGVYSSYSSSFLRLSLTRPFGAYPWKEFRCLRSESYLRHRNHLHGYIPNGRKISPAPTLPSSSSSILETSSSPETPLNDSSNAPLCDMSILFESGPNCLIYPCLHGKIG